MNTYHEGELDVQARAGVREMAARVGRGIRGTVPPPATEFLREARFAAVAGLDAAGRVWASPVVGAAGSRLEARGERALRMTLEPVAGDPLAAAFSAGAPVGLLAVDLATRRRMRLNGRVRSASAESVDVLADQIYSNCPKYIQRRTIVPGPPNEPGQARAFETLTGADARAIERADTFAIASIHPTAGADCSHRGGAPGFVRVVDDRTLAWPDYAGNAMFQTLGNVEADGRAGLLFVDFETGDSIQLSGRARILWDADLAASVPGAERMVAFAIERGVAIPGAVPLRWRLDDYSPFLPR